MVSKEQLVIPDNKDYRDLEETLALRAQLVQLALQDQEVRMEIRVQGDNLGR